jgi:hypothetical protein
MKLKAVRFRTMVKVGKGMQRDALDAATDKWISGLSVDEQGTIEVIVTMPGLHDVCLVPASNVTCMYPFVEPAISATAPLKVKSATP